MRVLEAGLYVKEKIKAVALLGMRIDAEVRDIASKTTITQIYKNAEDVAIEAVYCFPVEESAAVCGFEIETNGKIITGKAEEREKAFELYDKAIQAGDGSFLLDQELQDILVISAGNIKPGQEVKVTITSVSRLPVVDGTIRLQIPATVSPRYAPPDDDPVKADRITPPYVQQVPYTLELFIKVLFESISAITSPSHEISIEEQGEYKIVSLKNNVTRLDRDFILECTTKREGESVCFLTTHENGSQALLFRFFPHFENIAGKTENKSEVIFILDCSGSMQGSSIEEAKAALDLSLRSLNEGDLLRIIRFGNSWETYSQEPVRYGEKTLADALAYIRSISANMGGTELKGPVSYVCGLPKTEGYIRDVILLTDGEISNPDEVIHEVRKASENLRVFSFGIGYGASHHLIKGIARASGGAFEMIQPGEKIQPKVLRQFSRMSQPFLTGVSVELNGGHLELPDRLPPLFEGDDYTLFAGVTDYKQDQGEIVFSGNYLDSSFSWKAEVKRIDNDNTIPVLCALSRVKQIKEENIGGSGQVDRKRKAAEKMITELGLAFNILTEYTSFVAIEKREAGEKTNGQPEYRRIPVQLTRDWHGAGSDYGIVTKTLGTICPAPDAPERKFSKSFPFANLFDGGGHKDKKRKDTGSILYRNQCGGEEISEMQSHKHNEWYLDLLGTQQADGHFTGKAFVASYFNIPVNELDSIVSKVDIPVFGLKEKALVTLLAVHALSCDPDAHAVSKRAVKKAEKWLLANASLITINGIKADEYLKSHYHINL
ncbi:MAG: VWA domain-containing protein [Spirochaetales bacterium]|nr:VWA domain-containing protein [Spirochaetales bacterium]